VLIAALTKIKVRLSVEVAQMIVTLRILPEDAGLVAQKPNILIIMLAIAQAALHLNFTT
jgi:hypothetical protein